MCVSCCELELLSVLRFDNVLNLIGPLNLFVPLSVDLRSFVLNFRINIGFLLKFCDRKANLWVTDFGCHFL